MLIMTDLAELTSEAGSQTLPGLFNQPAAEIAPTRTPYDKRWLGLALIVVLLSLWEASARCRWVTSDYWPPFSLVLRAALYGLGDKDMMNAFLSTISRSALGYAAGSGVGIILGILLGVNRWARYLLLPIVEIVRPIPAPAIIPPLILFLGVDDPLKIFIVALACFFPVFTNAFAGVRSIDDTLLQTARTFRVRWLGTLFKVVFPASLPMLSAGLRAAISIALVVGVIVEMIAGASGIGYFIVQMQYAMRPDIMYAAVIYLAAIGYVLNRAFLVLERRAVPWIGMT
jgi:ABC-type nitrate/sulfonate/bicarbonate transport system permease component